MSDFFVRQSGLDSNSGTGSPANAWATIGKALGASGIASGDTLYVGAGVYREAVTVNMTSATAETKVVADNDGSKTGDPGIVRWTNVTDDRDMASGSNLLNLNGRDFLTFVGFAYDSLNIIITSSTLNATSITFRNCTFTQYANNYLITATFNQAVAWLFENCTFFAGRLNAINLTLNKVATSDYDAGVVFNCCKFIGIGAAGVVVAGGQSNTNKGGGVKALSCCFIGLSPAIYAANAEVSTTFPMQAQNCVIIALSYALYAVSTGQVIDGGYNLLLAGTPRFNVAEAPTSKLSTVAPLLEIGQSEFAGLKRRPLFSPTPRSPLFGFGNLAGSPTTDLLGRARPSGTIAFLESGTATSGGTTFLTDGGKAWRVNAWAGATLRITGGTGSGQTKHIISNNATQIIVSGNWPTTPDSSSTYEIYDGCPSHTFKATAGAAATVTDSTATFGVSRWAGYICEILSGTGAGQTRTVTIPHTNTVLTMTSSWTTNPDSTSICALYVATDRTTVQPGIGPYELHDTAKRETVVVDAGTNAVSAYGPWTHDFVIAVDAVSTTIGIKSQFDGSYGAGTKPRMQVVNGTECGVADASHTSTQTAGNWFSHTLTFTPTAKGIITVRLRADGAADSKVAFDSFTKA